ncbi:hypothetical protein ERC79_20225 [Rhodococcus sp. ABRD24]|uniref:beta-ketoacyl synthase N-terminal-like domain-containing protein n=1 Tax=Rhodococcus sp. ABRD24 TaxID=2507582 RepID=UPI00103ACD70|nr:beta-ketoacyl synthase N-terminal-like domain-containing protein [Rhodococcus sp. ABRD24]QBJ98005.1 hypothetical protein ERC79_20225 [Rhodococcus sp. ABRD24]
MRAHVLAWEGRYSDHHAAADSWIDPYPDSPRVRAAAPGDDRTQLLGQCVDAVIARAGLAGSLAVVTASQAPARSRPSNADEYGVPAGRLHPALADRDEILISHACASGGLALAVGASLVDCGAVEQALVVAAMRPRFIEAAAFRSSGALSNQPYCRPFDHEADGTALGGFTGAVLLGAADTGPQIAGIGIRTLGSGAQSDRASQHACMTDAIDMAGVAPQFVAAHATGTIHGDRVELDAVSDIGRDIGARLPVSSCKGSIGHAVHAAGLATALYALEAMATDALPGTARCTQPLEADHAEVVPSHLMVEGRGLNVALVNAFGFGGSSCSLVLQWDHAA